MDSLKMFVIDFHLDGMRVDSTNTLCVNAIKGTVIPEAWFLIFNFFFIFYNYSFL